MRIVVVGATSVIAQHCLRIWTAQEGNEFVLVGRDQQRLLRVASDLRVRNPSALIDTMTVDFNDADAISRMAQGVGEKAIDLFFYAQGSLTNQAEAQKSASYLSGEISANILAASITIEALASVFEKQGFGHIALIGSVAGDRARKSNYLYGASKAYLEFIADGLRHRFGKTRIVVSIIKPGPTSSPMTAEMIENKLQLAEPSQVAKLIVKKIALSKENIYSPSHWAPLMLLVRSLPNFIFRNLDF